MTIQDRILRIDDVLALTGLSRSTLYRLVASEDFPKPVQLCGPGGRAKGWRLSEVEEWIRNRPPAE